MVLSALEPPEGREAARRAVSAALQSGAPLSLGDLAVRGDDLREAGIEPGPVMGEVLRRLLEEALADPSRNTRAYLLQRAREIASESGR